MPTQPIFQLEYSYMQNALCCRSVILNAECFALQTKEPHEFCLTLQGLNPMRSLEPHEFCLTLQGLNPMSSLEPHEFCLTLQGLNPMRSLEPHEFCLTLQGLNPMRSLEPHEFCLTLQGLNPMRSLEPHEFCLTLQGLNPMRSLEPHEFCLALQGLNPMRSCTLRMFGYSVKFLDKCFDDQGYNLLHRSIMGAHFKTIQYLISEGMNLWQLSKDNITALGICIYNSPYTDNGVIPTYYTSGPRFQTIQYVSSTENQGVQYDSSGLISFDETATFLLYNMIKTNRNKRQFIRNQLCDSNNKELGLKHIAAAKGLFEFLKSASGIYGLDYLRCKDKFGVTPMYLAHIYNQTKIVRWMRKLKLQIKRPQKNSENLLLFKMIDNYKSPVEHDWTCLLSKKTRSLESFTSNTFYLKLLNFKEALEASQQSNDYTKLMTAITTSFETLTTIIKANPRAKDQSEVTSLQKTVSTLRDRLLHLENQLKIQDGNIQIERSNNEVNIKSLQSLLDETRKQLKQSCETSQYEFNQYTEKIKVKDDEIQQLTQNIQKLKKKSGHSPG
ncbi:unnamed protein product [Mytilus coruscus]|uniref:Uncharacterized protein n=1 Tax=Mytilus coruscus TaxID=42192 RepID=A0A6J8BTW1_MYTCO|nr:unnamed protein product [Mytilus coruscus]